jgi:protein SCO1/2
MVFKKLCTFLAAMSVVVVFSSAIVSPTIAQTQKRAQPEKATTYSCPMHPDVKSHKPARCPKCGMTLRLVSENETPPATEEKPVAKDKPATEKLIIPDVEVLDQDGRKLHFYTDLVKDRVVAINFIFTTCTTICPPLGATFARVQKDLGERTGREVQMISISVDPVTDTPERLKAWGEKFHAAHGWTFVTGAKPAIDELLRALGAATASPQDHSPTVLIGNDARGEWTRTYGLAPPRQILQLINNATENGSQ